MLRSITAKQFRGWQHFYDLDPFGEERASLERASIAQMVFNMAVSPDDRKSLSEFVLPLGDKDPSRQEYDVGDGKTKVTTKPPQSFEEQIMIAKIMVAASEAGARNVGE